MHGRVLEHGDGASEVGDHFGRHFTLFSDRCGQLAGVELDVLDVGLDFGSELLQMLDNRHVHRLGQVGMVVCNGAGLLALLAVGPWVSCNTTHCHSAWLTMP